MHGTPAVRGLASVHREPPRKRGSGTAPGHRPAWVADLSAGPAGRSWPSVR